LETDSSKRALEPRPVTVTDAWQIGSSGPPKVCLCCGLPFDEKRVLKGPYTHGPYIWVCSPCWELPFLFFPDKVLAPDGESWLPNPDIVRQQHPEVSDKRPDTKKIATASGSDDS